MIGFIIVIHVIACALLIIMILIQRGRGSGLVEAFSGVESMFGTKTSAFLARTTTILSVIFFLTCLSLAILSSRQSRSLMQDLTVPAVDEKAAAVDVTPVAVDEKAPVVQEEPPVVPALEVTPTPQATQPVAAAAPAATAQSPEVPNTNPQEAPKAE